MEGPLETRSDQHAVLLCHDGELGDVRSVLDGLEIGFRERLDAPWPEDDGIAWDLIVGTPARLLEVGAGSNGQVPLRIAVLDKPTRTLMAMLQRARIEFWVRRPVHPTALRLLLLHALYRGPERRRRQRVSVGAPIRFRAGLRRRPAVLAELSTRGCRLLTRHAARYGSALTLTLPGSLSGHKGLQLSGRVVRTGPASGGEVGTQAIAVVFEALSSDQLKRVRRIVDVFARGPAMLSETDAARVAKARTRRSPTAHSDPPESTPADREELPEARDPEVAAEAAPTERRRDRRRQYATRVIALGEEAARVLIGRDISLGGMRVDPHPGLEVGDAFEIAVHVRDSTEPLVVKARVERDDGERGLVLQFRDLRETERDLLQKMVTTLPYLCVGAGQGTESGVVVSEILEWQQHGISTPSKSPDQQAEA